MVRIEHEEEGWANISEENLHMLSETQRKALGMPLHGTVKKVHRRPDDDWRPSFGFLSSEKVEGMEDIGDLYFEA